jgi:hypothetical protein
MKKSSVASAFWRFTALGSCVALLFGADPA